MLEHLPRWLGALLHDVRAGASKLTIVDPALGDFAALNLASTAFADGARLPERFTADGTGVSPPLYWTGVPAGTETLALVVEDPDAPAAQPLVHAIVWGMPPSTDQLREGAIQADGDGALDGSDVGRNSYLREGWLPPDPPSGHGEHRYVFQLFALGPGEDLDPTPGRGAVVHAMAGRVLAAGLLTATYSRDEPADIGPVGSAVPSPT
ncbi:MULTISPECIES: YbhB/YbcL family Raf kinase inhibitor-like protein [Sphingomonas]|uniref:YbhB/YbcL family Raf kinase inhibitor-like protein n=1 Tax=Sphingomonas molluscorum TaxID=418184 RepID=A0ABU8Q1P9_9SPHN|nr:YbhB/YbcL family Raf kinase inhibitor-like protein [Sphingomonas sp. JUb134]MBM7405164.1 Raf kinase inhibitor-like YbhB/YbcL family protein [Sphingomonas sp. JUb134]